MSAAQTSPLFPCYTDGVDLFGPASPGASSRGVLGTLHGSHAACGELSWEIAKSQLSSQQSCKRVETISDKESGSDDSLQMMS